MEEESLKKITLFEELETSIRLIKLGFGEYQNLDLANDFYYLPFQLISSGLERFMKCHICFGHQEKHNVFPSTELFKNKLKQDLHKLQDHITANYFQTKNASALKADLKYIKEDSELRELIGLLSEFGKFARYYNLSVVTGETNPGIDVKKQWQQFETNLIKGDENLLEKLGNIQFQKEVLYTTTRYVIIKLERLTRALSRQFTLGGLGSIAQQHSSVVYPFLMLKDDELGITDYRKETTGFKKKNHKPHKRTILNEIERKVNKNLISKTIRKKDYTGDWPFYNDSIIIECRYKNWCVVTIDGFDYALNGSAKGKYKIEDVHEAGMAVLGKSISPFIKMTFELLNENKN
ncbi:MAG: hypothetical protein PF484_08920 [Bacteroidales bacterium]|jgi:hypothetical protein|nr:hypothetical protein [Bacteroidales bacterium]